MNTRDTADDAISPTVRDRMQSRGICTCARLSNMQLGRIMNKVMNSEKSKKSRFKELPNHSNALQTPSFGPKIPKSTHKSRRVTILNNVFMKYISDLMATSEISNILQGRGIEISHVKVSPDFALVNVYWFSDNINLNIESTEKILKKTAGKLQHELSQLRIIGNVPPIYFVKNKFYNTVKEVELRLSQVDFGEDFVPSTYITSRMKFPVLQTSLPPKIKAKLYELENNKNEEEKEGEEEDMYEIKIPEMRQDVMGFDHAAIMKRIKGSLTKSRFAQQKMIMNEPQEPQGQQANPNDVATFLDSKEQQELFDDFLKKRLMEEKRRTQSKSLLEIKLQEEEDLAEDAYDFDTDEFNIDEDSGENDYFENNDIEKSNH